MRLAMLDHPKMTKMLEESGLCNLGAYTLLYVILECKFDGAATRKELIQTGNLYTGRKILEHVLDKSGLFYLDTDGKIHSSVFIDEEMKANASRTREGVRVGVREGACTGVDNILLLENKEQEKEKKQEKKDENLQGIIVPPAFQVYQNEPWFSLVYPLTETGGKNGIWFDAVCHSAHSWSILLARQWQEAIAQFMSYLLRKRKGDGIRNTDDAKSFFSNYVDSEYTGPRLREYLMKVEKNEI